MKNTYYWTPKGEYGSSSEVKWEIIINKVFACQGSADKFSLHWRQTNNIRIGYGW